MTTLIHANAPAFETESVAPAAAPASAVSRFASLLYGSLVYVLFLGTFLYMIGFVAGAIVPKHIDSGTPSPLGLTLLINGGFLALFAIQHTIMARPAFKARWTRIVPAQVERSTFVLVTCAILIGMIWQWRPLPGVVWHLEGPVATALWVLSGLGWATVLVATFLINHFDLFGLRQVVSHFLGGRLAAPKFYERGLYRIVRHPLMTGFLIAFWATPHMTWGHLLFAGGCTGYILFGLMVEERDLIREHGELYLDYRRRVRGLLPLPRRSA